MKKVAIIGAGISGATCANIILQNCKNAHICVFDKREHIAGNCFDPDYVHVYGAHIFHTNNGKVWEFVNRFQSFWNYQHHVMVVTNSGDHMLPFPASSEHSQEWIVDNVFKIYSLKQWGETWDELPEVVKSRVPKKRENEDTRYFLDKYQGLPKVSYLDMVRNMFYNFGNYRLKFYLGIEADYELLKDFDYIISSGSIDHFCGYDLGVLPYRSLRWVHNKIQPGKRFPQLYVKNDCTFNNSYTRSYDSTIWQENPNLNNGVWCTHTEEFPVNFVPGLNDPIYPVFWKGQDLYNKYIEQFKDKDNIFFTGRLGLYSYLNMDQAIEKSMETAERVVGLINSNN